MLKSTQETKQASQRAELKSCEPHQIPLYLGSCALGNAVCSEGDDAGNKLYDLNTSCCTDCAGSGGSRVNSDLSLAIAISHISTFKKKKAL